MGCVPCALLSLEQQSDGSRHLLSVTKGWWSLLSLCFSQLQRYMPQACWGHPVTTLPPPTSTVYHLQRTSPTQKQRCVRRAGLLRCHPGLWSGSSYTLAWHHPSLLNACLILTHLLTPTASFLGLAVLSASWGPNRLLGFTHGLPPAYVPFPFLSIWKL